MAGYRLLTRARDTTRKWGLSLLGAMVVLNTAWNYLFLGLRFGLGIACLFFYVPIVLALFVLLLRRDRTSAWVMVPYLLYLAFATALSVSVSILHSEAGSGA